MQQGEERSRSALGEAKSLGNSGDDQVGVADGSERNGRDAISKVLPQSVGHLEGQAGFADPAGAGEGEQAHLGAAQEATGGYYLLLAPNQRGQLGG